MSTLRAIGAILRADLQQRVRTPRFWFVVLGLGAFMWWCFPPVEADYLTVSVGESLRGRYSSAWIGMVVALIYCPLLSLTGFYLVRGTVTRDLDTRAWQLLVATTMSRPAYLIAKWLSHMTVFAGVLFVGLAIGLGVQWLRAEDLRIDVIELLKPTLLITLPALALTAALAVWFDLVPWLRRSAGNVVFFVLFVVLVSGGVSQAPGTPGGATPFPGDLHGMVGVEGDLSRWPAARAAVQAQLARAAATPGLRQTNAAGVATVPMDASLGLSVGTQDLDGHAPILLDWPRWDVSSQTLKSRLFWLLVGVAVLLAATPFLDRFAAHRSAGMSVRNRGATLGWLDRVLRPLQRSTNGALLAAELRLALRSRRWWWWLAMAAAFATQLAAPDEGMAIGILGGWLLCMDVFSRLVLREHDSRTAALVFTAPGMRVRLLATRTVMAVGLAWAVTLPALLRLAATHPGAAVATLVAGASLAVWGLASGAVFRNARPFELVLLVAAYVSAQGALLLNTLTAPETTLLWHALSLPLAVAVLAVAWRQGLAARV